MTVAVEKETQLEAWLEENMPEPGGGNPNYVETITGTLANPWGDIDISKLLNEVRSYGATALLSADLSILSPGVIIRLVFQYDGFGEGQVPFGQCGYNNDQWANLIAVYMKSSGSLSMAKIQNSGSTSDIVQYASLISTTLIIIHHPLPEN